MYDKNNIICGKASDTNLIVRIPISNSGYLAKWVLQPRSQAEILAACYEDFITVFDPVMFPTETRSRYQSTML